MYIKSAWLGVYHRYISQEQLVKVKQTLNIYTRPHPQGTIHGDGGSQGGRPYRTNLQHCKVIALSFNNGEMGVPP
jgi:hypothetical protein